MTKEQENEARLDPGMAGFLLMMLRQSEEAAKLMAAEYQKLSEECDLPHNQRKYREGAIRKQGSEKAYKYITELVKNHCSQRDIK
ncbi:MAG: hypothetical protein WC775_06215 [Patescibacteria group bacterium]|jgi:hypothetical protein